MASLLREFKGKIDLIYIDPPSTSGADFTMNVPIGDGEETMFMDQSVLEMVASKTCGAKAAILARQQSFFHANSSGRR
jgi:hypothetical protein